MGVKGNITGGGSVQITNTIRIDFTHIDRGQFILVPMGPIMQIWTNPVPTDVYFINIPEIIGDFRFKGYVHPTITSTNPLGLTSPTVNHYIMTMWKYEGSTGGNVFSITDNSGRIGISNYDPINKRYPQDFKASDLDDGTVQFSEALLSPYFVKV